MPLPGPPALPLAAGGHPRPGGGVTCWWRGLSPSGQSLPFRLNYPGALSCRFAHTPLPPRDGDVGGGLWARRGPGAAGQLPGVRSRPTLWMPRRQVLPEMDRLCPLSPPTPRPRAAALRRPLLAVMWGWTRTPWVGMKTGPAALKSSLRTSPSARTRWPSG